MFLSKILYFCFSALYCGQTAYSKELNLTASAGNSTLSATIIEDPDAAAVLADQFKNKNEEEPADPRLGPLWESLTYEKLYEEGIKHYLDNNWHQCVSFFKSAIDDYRWHTATLTK